MAPTWRPGQLQVPAPHPGAVVPLRRCLFLLSQSPHPLPPYKLSLPTWRHRPMVPLPRSAPAGPASVCISEPQTVHPPGTTPVAPASPSPYAGLQHPWGAPRALLPELPSPYSHDDQEVTWLHSCHHGEGVPTRLVLKTARNSASGIPILVVGTPLCFCPWPRGVGVYTRPSASPHPIEPWFGVRVRLGRGRGW